MDAGHEAPKHTTIKSSKIFNVETLSFSPGTFLRRFFKAPVMD
jgi:hypothetical protein